MNEGEAGDMEQAAETGPARFSVRQIDAVLLSLPELERAVYLNHRKGGLSYRTIARRLGVTTREVERIIASALLRLKQAFDAIERERRR
jgi:DNA-directed RNA polymerase specialized sigma24 family protein